METEHLVASGIAEQPETNVSSLEIPSLIVRRSSSLEAVNEATSNSHEHGLPPLPGNYGSQALQQAMSAAVASHDQKDAERQTSFAEANEPSPEDIELIRCAKELFRQGQYEECVSALRKGAAQGIPAAQTLLGECYAQGKGVKQDWSSAAKCYRVAAMLGDGFGSFRLAACLQRGKGGTTPNEKEAFEWYQKAGAAGIVEATFRAAVICVDNQDLVSAMKLFMSAGRKGHRE
ncbi:hypothetical protein HDU93_002533, partial [Gonapodya sp. JEL0774]